MKTLKRFLSLTLVCLLLCGLLPSFALADDSTAGEIVLTDAAGQPGDTVTVDLQLTSNPGIVVLQVKSLSFDSTVLELSEVAVSFESGWNQTIVKETGSILLDKDPSANSTFTGAVATYTFKILDTAAAGDTTINLDLVACDKEENYVTFNVTPATVTVKEAGEPKLDVKFNHSVSIANNLNINYYVKATYLEGFSNIRLVAEKDTATGTMTREITGTVTSGYYRFQFARIAAKEMGDDIHVKVCADKDGVTYVSDEDVYSIRQYAYNSIRSDKTEAKLKLLLVDMLNYGSAAQTYFGYHIDKLVNGELTAEEAALGTAEAPTLVSHAGVTEIATTTANIAGNTLQLENSIEVNYYLTINEGQSLDNLKLVISYTSKNEGNPVITRTIPASSFTRNGNYYVAKLDSIESRDASCVITAAVYDGDQQISHARTYSIETYAYNTLNSTTAKQTLKTLVTEMMKYCNSADAYFTK